MNDTSIAAWVGNYGDAIIASKQLLNNTYDTENGRSIAAWDYDIMGDSLSNLGDLDHINATRKYEDAIKCLDIATNLNSANIGNRLAFLGGNSAY